MAGDSDGSGTDSARHSGRDTTLEIDDNTRVRHTVTEEDTAAAVGSGSLPVLATPRLLAWCEGATCAVAEPRLGRGRTTVGTEVRLQHRAPSPVGAELEVEARVTAVEGSRLRFAVTARHLAEEPDGIVAEGEVVRAVVGVERFLARLGG